MTNGTGSPDGARLWRAEDGLHVDVRGLPCPEPLVTVLRLIDARETGEVLFAHLSQAPLLLYPELDDRGWRHQLIATSSESCLEDVGLLLKMVRSPP